MSFIKKKTRKDEEREGKRERENLKYERERERKKERDCVQAFATPGIDPRISNLQFG